MKSNAAVEHAVACANLSAPVASIRNFSGGCIHEVVEVTLADGRRFVAKINDAAMAGVFEEEVDGLEALAATGTVLVPQPLGVTIHESTVVLLMTAIEGPSSAPSKSAWKRLGADLAALHSADAGPRYGFDMDNHIGSTVQPNSWRDDWVEFNSINRLGFQLGMACQRELLTPSEADAIKAVIDRLDRLIPRHPKPALLHGDLWSGNALPAANDRIAVLDPACSIGDGWADIAMMRLFGAFPQACFDAYQSLIRDHERIESRIAVYQLYHVLNHVNIFGRGYAGQTMQLARALA